MKIIDLVVTIILSLSAFLTTTVLNAQNQRISGIVINAENGEGLPFATIKLSNSNSGVTSNLEGMFELLIPISAKEESINISYIGFKDHSVPVSKLKESDNKIVLEMNTILLSEVTIRPLSPQEYIKRAMRKRTENYSHEFNANAYFKQVTTDKGEPIIFAEGYFDTYSPSIQDTSTKLQQRLLLYQNEEDMSKMEFGTKRADKKFAKAKKKAKKNDEDFNEEEARKKARNITIGMISPSDAIELDPIYNIEAYLDSNRFDDYKYQFGDDVIYQGRKTTIILFESKGKVKSSDAFPKGKHSGKIYFDQSSGFFSAISIDQNVNIPTALKPILFLLGYSISNPKVKGHVNYQYHNSTWYPQSTRYDMEIGMEKRYLFSENEQSDIKINMLVNFSNWEDEKVVEIPEEYRQTYSKKMEDQVYPREGVSWETINRIPFETIIK